MYMIEAEQNFGEDYSTAFHFVGEANEVEAYKAGLFGLTLGALCVGAIKDEDAYRLFYDLTDSDITNRSVEKIKELSIDETVYKNERLRAVTREAGTGKMDTASLFKEFKLLDNFGLDDPDIVTWLSRDGLQLTLQEGELGVLRIYDELDPVNILLDESGLNPKISKELGINASAIQHGVAYDEYGTKPRINELAHDSLGVVDAEGNYTPVLTILNEAHPVRAGAQITATESD